MSDIDQAYSWDSPAQIEENQFNVMPNGTIVEFEVKKIEKAHNQKLNCPAMEISLFCKSENYGCTFVNESISLHSKAQYFINAFFSSIGLLGSKKTFGQLVQDAIGRKGKAKLKQNSWQGRDGDTFINNKVDKYLKYEPPSQNQPIIVEKHITEDEDSPF